jgi:hypothetical protein
MVHALSEIHRVLVRGGVLIDLRPISERWLIEIISSQGIQQTGHVIDTKKAVEDDKAADKALEQAASQGFFVQEQATSFAFNYSWDTPKEMEKYIEEEWENDNALDDQTIQATRSAWAAAGADAKPRIQLKMILSRWRKS